MVKQSEIFSFLMTVSVITIIVALIYFISPILPPFLVGALLAWLLNPLVQRLMRHWHFPRVVAVLSVFIIFLLILTCVFLVIVPLISAQITRLANFIPTIVGFIQQKILPGFGNIIDVNIVTLKKTLADNWMKAGGVFGWMIQFIFHSGIKIIALAGTLILIPVVAMYLLYDWEKVLRGIRSLLPRKYASVIVAVVKECDEVLAAFFRGQLLVMLTLGVIYSVALTLLGIQVGVLIGLLTGLLAIVPYLGVITGVTVASTIAWVQTGSWHAIIPILILFIVVQTADAMFITPRLVGNRIGLHPVAVIFAILAGGTLSGFTGVLLALPVTAMLRVLARFFLGGHYRSVKTI